MDRQQQAHLSKDSRAAYSQRGGRSLKMQPAHNSESEQEKESNKQQEPYTGHHIIDMYIKHTGHTLYT